MRGSCKAIVRWPEAVSGEGLTSGGRFLYCITSWQMEKQQKQRKALFFLGSKITAVGDSSHEIKRLLLLGKKVMTNLDSILKSQIHSFANKGPFSQSYGFSSSHAWM